MYPEREILYYYDMDNDYKTRFEKTNVIHNAKALVKHARMSGGRKKTRSRRRKSRRAYRQTFRWVVM